ncbi:MAG: N-acetyl-1-D-myo-inositol-2-amino-2-deoxy-alpha-D-glucopyranoside deacetylase [Mycobacteriales bacterium]
MSDRRLLLVHAHPDDETIGMGATMAAYAARGDGVTLVTCTLGEEGEVLVPELAHLAADRDDTLGEHRIGELARACAALGVADHRFLGGPGRYRDSGMMGLPSNDRPGCFWRASPEDTTADIVRVIREVRPQVAAGYDENGGYGHPDHIQAHRVLMAGVEAAADSSYRPDLGEPWTVSKVYWSALPKSVLAEGIKIMSERGSMFEGVESVDDLPMGTPDDVVTTQVDAREFLPLKIEAMRAHATQIATDGPFFALADGVGRMSFGTEYYQLVRGELGSYDGRYEPDLFAGL